MILLLLAVGYGETKEQYFKIYEKNVRPQKSFGGNSEIMFQLATGIGQNNVKSNALNPRIYNTNPPVIFNIYMMT